MWTDIYKDRLEAGERLKEIYDGPREKVVVLGIPRGGIPVGYPLARDLRGILDVIVVRKLPIPWSPEAGFGAIAPDGTITLNQDMLRHVHIPEEIVHQIAAEVLEEVHRRERIYRGERPFPALEGKNVIVTDDGLATGYTMIAAVNMIRERRPQSITVAVPVSPADSARRVEPLVDRFICPIISRSYPFAVASFYQDFHDLSDEEVKRLLS